MSPLQINEKSMKNIEKCMARRRNIISQKSQKSYAAKEVLCSLYMKRVGNLLGITENRSKTLKFH